MKKKIPSLSCQQAAERIQPLFSKKEAQEDASKKKSSLRSHKCNAMKFPSTALYGMGQEKIKKRVPQKKTISSFQVRPVTSSWNALSLHAHDCCSKNQKYISQEHKRLSSDRVMRWQLKEHLLAARKLKGIKKPSYEQHKVHEITLMTTQPSSNKEGAEQQEIWNEYLRFKQERELHMPRIIKYLSN